MLSHKTVPALTLLAGAPSASALVTPDSVLSYADLAERVHSRREDLGVTRRLVMISGRNTIEPLVTYLAALEAGHPVLLLAGDAHDRGNRELVERYDPDVVLTGENGGWRLEERRDGSRHELHPELALLASTSGSSGSPKLVRLSRENVLSNARSIAEYLALTPADRAATTLPIHYCYGLSVLNSHLVAGASLLLTERSVVEPEFWGEFDAAAATSFAGVPYTFDLLESIGFRERDTPSLRYITQAGGRLGPARVRDYARLGRERGFDFVVMYGQTEATARMAYLPPGLAEARPESIGVPIPGGRFRIAEPGDDGAGELVYAGPNVMMGYAESPTELALGRTVDELRTGDIARQHDDGLYEIIGRRSRFAKVYGLRLDLDRLERMLADEGLDVRAVSHEERVLLFVRDEWALGLVAPVAADALGLPRHSVRAELIDEFPLTSSGKPDTAALLRHAAVLERDAPTQEPNLVIAPDTIRDVYAAVLERPDADLDSSFVALGGDSLSHVEVSLRLEHLLGTLPRDWPERSPRELAGTEAPKRVTRLRRLFAPVEAAVTLRALAIVVIVGTHANLFGVQGGAHVLLAVFGFNMARFQLAAVSRTVRLRNLLRSAAHIAVPGVLWIGGVALALGSYEPATAFLLNGALGGDHWTTQWQYWFLEAIVWAMLGTALVLAVPAIDRLERRHPFAFAAGLVVGALMLRLLLAGITVGATERYSLPVVLWLIVLGWLIARAAGLRQRLVCSLLVVLTVPGFFGDLGREAVVVAGLLILIWVSGVPLPRHLIPLVRVLASASLFVYLVHWQVYPLLEDDFPLLATLASFAAGIVAWRIYLAVTRGAARFGARPRAARRSRRSASA